MRNILEQSDDDSNPSDDSYIDSFRSSIIEEAHDDYYEIESDSSDSSPT